ncbi:MAG: putative quinol monooxygenase [Flavobacteriales bacterium]
MTFEPSQCDAFLEIFEKYHDRIRAAEGCRGLKLLRQLPEGAVFFTYSLWDDPSFLDIYRNSATFGEVWPLTKALFAAPAEAWTCLEEYNL